MATTTSRLSHQSSPIRWSRQYRVPRVRWGWVDSSDGVDGEEFRGQEAVFEDLGGNLCGCPARARDKSAATRPPCADIAPCAIACGDQIGNIVALGGLGKTALNLDLAA
jgi:hypothetical protein